MKREDAYYAALTTRDHRFDGKFFVGVKTTGIYCRPICPAKPKRENVEFFPNYREAERAGYRPCLRCRPESAPRSPAWIGTSAVVRRAVRSIGELANSSEEKFSARFGLSARHLRRLFVSELGATPKQIFAEQRLNLARQLLVETSMSVASVAHAAGFGSVRRFNDAFRKRFTRSPSQVKKKPSKERGLVLFLSYRPPYDFEGLLQFYESHRVEGLEQFLPGEMTRLFRQGKVTGKIKICNDPVRSRLKIDLDCSSTEEIQAILLKVRRMFDLDSDPLIVANSLESDPKTKKVLARHPGIRLPSGWDPFEVAVSAILGQFVSVDRGRALVGDLISLFGEPAEFKGEQFKLFPTAKILAESDFNALKTTRMRKRTIGEFSRRVACGELSLELTQPADEFMDNVQKIPGIGPWTAAYMAMKVLGHPDAFPETDLILARALKIHGPAVVEEMRPWRAYAAALYWREYSEKLRKEKL